MQITRNYWIMIGFAVAVVFVSAGIILTRQARASDSIELANSKTVYLGQDADDLEKQFGVEIVERDDMPGVYRYPSDYGRPAQANVYTEGGKVVAVIVGRETGHQYLDGKIRVGSSTNELRQVFGKQLTVIDKANGPIKQSGYQVEGRTSVKLFVTETCLKKNREQVVIMALAKKDSVSKLTYISRPLNCSTAQSQQSN
jgi:hypothetical protein